MCPRSPSVSKRARSFRLYVPFSLHSTVTSKPSFLFGSGNLCSSRCAAWVERVHGCQLSSGPALCSGVASEAVVPLLGDPGHGLEGLLENLEDAGGLTTGPAAKPQGFFSGTTQQPLLQGLGQDRGSSSDHTGLHPLPVASRCTAPFPVSLILSCVGICALQSSSRRELFCGNRGPRRALPTAPSPPACMYGGGASQPATGRAGVTFLSFAMGVGGR